MSGWIRKPGKVEPEANREVEATQLNTEPPKGSGIGGNRIL